MAAKNHQGFSSGRTVKARELQYIQRSADAALLDHCKNGRPAYILHSPHMGKSSLITQTAEQLNAATHHAILIDLSQFPLPPQEEEWFSKIVRILDDNLDLDTDPLNWWEEHQNLLPHTRLTQLLIEIVLPETTKPVVLFIDEIERTITLPFRQQFFEWLSTIYESRETNSTLYRLSFVVCGVATPAQLIPEDDSSIFQWSHRVVLSDFTLEETLPLAEGLSLPTDAAREVMQWIYRWAHGHPYLTQLLSRLLEEQHRTSWSKDDVDECIRHFLNSPQGRHETNIQFVRTSLTEPNANGVTLLEPYLQLLEGKTDALKDNPQAVEQLRLVGVLRESDEDIAIRNLLYQEAFPMTWAQSHLQASPAQIESSPPAVTPPAPAPQQSYVLAASLLLVGIGLLWWLFQGPASSPPSTQTEQVSSTSQNTQPAPSNTTKGRDVPQQSKALLAAQEKIQELETTLANYQQLSTNEAQNFKDQRAQLETQLVSKDETLATLKTKIQELENALADQEYAHDNTIADLQAGQEHWQAKTTAAEHELESALEEVKTLQMAILKNSTLSPSEINTLMADRSRLEAQVKAANTKLAQAQDHSRELDSLLTQEQQLVEKTKKELSEERTRLNTKIKELETTVQDTRQALTQTEESAEQHAKLAQTELRRLQEDRNETKKLLAASQEELTGVKTQKTNLETALAQKDHSIQEERQERTKLSTALQDLRSKDIRATNRIGQLETLLAQERESANNTLTSVQQEREQLRNQLTEAQRDLNSAKTQIATLGDQLLTAGAQALQSKNALQTIHASSSDQARRTEEKIADLTSARSALQKQIEEREAALAQLQEERDQYSQKLNGTKQQLANAQGQIQRLEQSLQSASAKIAEERARQTTPSSSSPSLTSPGEDDIINAVSTIAAKLTQTPSPIQSETARLLWARQAYTLNLRTQGTQLAMIDQALRANLHATPVQLKGMPGRIHTLTFDHSGDHIIGGTSKGTILIWSMANPLKAPRILTGHSAGVLSVTVSPNGQQLASGSLDSTIRLWNLLQPQKPPRILQAHIKGVTSLAFRPDGKELASGSQDRTIRLWDLTHDQVQQVELGTHAGRVNAIAYSPDGKTLFSGGDDLSLRIWDLQRRDVPPRILRGHQQSISTISVHPSGWMVATGSRDRQIGLWNLRQSLITPTFLQGAEERISDIQFSPDGTSLASVSSDKSLRIWDWEQPTQPPIQFPKHKGNLEALAISSDGQTIATGGSNQRVTLWSGTEQLAHAVCDTAKENLSFSEWKNIVGKKIPYERTCPNLPLHPSFLEEGKRLAKEGSRDQAESIFQRAKQLDPFLEFDPKKEVDKLSAKS